jgi:photosystem II stability/assembly factor-like uncharacterized protein
MVNESDRSHRQSDLVYAARSKTHAWRSNRFELTHGADEDTLTKFRDLAVEQKLRLIKSAGPAAKSLAGFDPAGAGSPWYSIGPRNVNGRVKSLAIHPTNANIVYAGAASGGVWKSIDGGQIWDPLWDMQTSLAIGALGISKSSPNTIYAGTGEWTPGWGPSYGGAGVYLSTDAGVTWSPRPSVQARRVGKLVVHPTDPNTVWLCGDHGLEKSTNGGTTWTTLKAGTITDIVLDPANPNVVLIAVQSDKFYRSTNGGTTFAALAGAPTGASLIWPQIAIGVSGAHANNFIVIKMGGNVQKSIDGGATFNAAGTRVGFYAGWCDVIACAPDNEQIIFWGGIGMDRTGDGGTTWTSLPVHSDQHAAVFAPSNSNIVYFANDGGVWRSDDKGVTVRKVSNGLVISQFYNINFWTTLSNVVGAGAQDNQTNYTTGGLTWRPVFGGDGGWFVIDPLDPRTMYAEYQNANVAKSVDGGLNWVAKTAGIVGSPPWEGALVMDPNNHMRLFYGTNQVLRTNDGCATAWTSVSQVLVGEVTAVEIAPSDSNRVYAGTSSGKLYRTDDGGNTNIWADKSGTLPNRMISSVTVDAGNRDAVLVSIAGLSTVASSQSVYRTTNGGTSWSDVSGDLPKVVGNSVVRDPSDPANTWYLATDTGLFRTTNAGAHWMPFDNGIPNVPVSDLTVDAAAKILYCATMGRGAFKLDIKPGVTKPTVDIYLRDDDLDTGERFPSPSGLPDPLLPAPAMAFAWMSPDIKTNHAPVFAPGTVFDGVDFDLTLQHQNPWRGATDRFFVQVHNRGWQDAHNVSVRAFIADASAGLPNLQAALVPPAFNLPAGPWTAVGPAKNIALLKPNRPAVVFWDFAVPLSAATHTCCLAVISSPDDPLTNNTTNVWQLITMDKRVCLKNLHVVDVGLSPMGMVMTTIDFHNPGKDAGVMDIVIDPIGFARGIVALLLPKLELDPVKSLRGVTIRKLVANDPIGTWDAHGDEKLQRALTARLDTCDRTRIFEFDQSKASEIVGIKLAGGQSLHGILVSRLKGDTSTIAAPQFHVVQRLNGKVCGGSTFQFGTTELARIDRAKLQSNRTEVPLAD